MPSKDIKKPVATKHAVKDAKPKPAVESKQISESKDDDDTPKRATKSDQEYSAEYNLPLQDVQDIRNLFNSIDVDGGGEIDAGELRNLLTSLGRNVTQAQAVKMIKEVDTDGGGTVDFEEFLKLIAKEAAAEKKKDPVVEARRIFEMFDKDKSGSIDLKELKEAMQAMGQHLPDEDLRQLMKEADDDDTGEIDFEEYCKLIGVVLPPSYQPKPTPATRSATQPQAKPAATTQSKEDKDHSKIDPRKIFSRDEIKNLQEVFDLFDEDKSGSITIDELEKMMTGLGRKVTESQLKEMIASVDDDGTGAIELEEFLLIMAKDSMQRDPFAEAMATFKLFDTDGSGTISAEELGQALRASGQDISNDDASKLLATVDADGSGEIEFDEFCKLMGLDVKQAKPEHLQNLKQQAPAPRFATEDRLTEKQKKQLEREAQERRKLEEEEQQRKQGRDEWQNLLGKPLPMKHAEVISIFEASFKYQYPLHKAAAAGNTDEVRSWCTGSNGRKLDADEQDSTGWTPIMWAASEGNVDTVQYLIEFGVALNVADFDKRQALHLAVIQGSEDIVRALLGAEAPPSPKDRFGDSPLHWAARNGEYRLVLALLEKQAEVNLGGDLSETPLHWAAKRAHKDVCRLLVSNGASVKAKDDARTTPLDWAKDPEVKDIVRPPPPPDGAASPQRVKGDKASRTQAKRFTQGLTALKTMREGKAGLRKKPGAAALPAAADEAAASHDDEDADMSSLLRDDDAAAESEEQEAARQGGGGAPEEDAGGAEDGGGGGSGGGGGGGGDSESDPASAHSENGGEVEPPDDGRGG